MNSKTLHSRKIAASCSTDENRGSVGVEPQKNGGSTWFLWECSVLFPAITIQSSVSIAHHELQK
jgi:hypothetical protein